MHDATIGSPPLGYHVNPMSDDVGLAEIFSALRRRAWILAAVVVPVMAIVALALTMLTPHYTAEVLIMIEADGTSNIVSLDSVVTGLSGDSESVQSEAYVLNSRALADRVVQKLELANDRELTAELTPQAGSERSAVAYSQLIETFLDRLTVLPLEDSRVISVKFWSEDPAKAATIANTLAEEYLQSRLENKYELTQRASAWLNRRIDELRGEVAQAEAAVERARGQFGLLQGDGLTLATQELVEVNTQLVLARTQRAEAEARLQEVNRLLRTASGATATTEVLGSNLIQRLREQQAEVQRRVAELSSELGDKHPRMIQLRAEADDLNARIDGEISKIVSGLRNQVNVARARETALQKRLDKLKDRAAAANQSDIQVRALEREAEANRSLLNNLLARQKETLSQEELGFQQPDASIFSPAGVPAEPSFPKPALMLGLGFIGSLVIALLLILIAELLDSGFRSGEQFEQATGVPSIGFVPLTKRPADYRTMAGYAAGRPSSAFSEAVRTLNWSLTLAFPDSPPRVVLITSALPGEGKTTIASTLATIQCNAGQTVALIDADIRRPGCHEILGVDREPGLTNLLAGELSLNEALVSSEWSQLKVIPAGTRSAHASNLLGSKKMAELIGELANRFDMVVIDSPPLLAAADARILSRVADATVLIVRWGKTRRQVVKLATRQLETAGARLAGGLLSMVDVRRNAKYSYGDSDAYSGDLEKYYAG
jgi:succinoglycan biosynthesis transport protein ExoP